TLAELIAPALALARDGIAVEGDLHDSLLMAQPRLARFPSSARIFMKSDSAPLGAGDRLVQRDLAETLDAIAHPGAPAFYNAPIADEIVAAVADPGGRLTRLSHERNRPVLRRPVSGRLAGYGNVTRPP